MRTGGRRQLAAVGFTVKSGWAGAVLLAGTPAAPAAVEAGRVALSDPAVPESRQPYHDGFGTARRSGPALERLLTAIERFARESVGAELRRHQAAGYELCGVGLVVGSLIDPATIANDHIRIHALEGRLFRGVIQRAAARSGLPSAIWRARDLYAAASVALARPEPGVRAAAAALGRGLPAPWRAEHKHAALAAWLVLAGQGWPRPAPARQSSATARATVPRR